MPNNDVLATAVTTTNDFDAWLTRHSKSHVLDSEYQHRFAIFAQNAALVQKHNHAFAQGWTHYAMSLEQSPFADLTDEEFRTSHLMEWQNCSATTHKSSGSVKSLVQQKMENHDSTFSDKKFVDWRTKGIVTPVKNQGGCGSCWTFSTTGSLEAHHCLAALKTKQNAVTTTRGSVRGGGGAQEDAESLSYLDCTSWTGLAEQQLLDCADPYDNHGCNGGLPSHAFEYIKAAGGLYTEKSYPYLANSTGTTCMATQQRKHLAPPHSVVQVAEVFNITSRDEEDLVQAVGNLGPVSVAYQVSPDFRFYSHGVYDSYNATTNSTMCQNDAQSVNHAVVAVGLGQVEEKSDNGAVTTIPYYIIRNSWGTMWGMEGYFWMKRGENLCGVGDCASFPIVPVADAIVATAAKK